MPHPAPFASPDAIIEAVAPPTSSVAVQLVNDAARLGQLELALGLLDASRRRFGSDPGLDLAESALRARGGQLEAAGRLVKSLQSQAPVCLVAQVYAAQLLLQAGHRNRAAEQLFAVVQACPEYPGVAGALASALMPGPGYRDVLRGLQQSVAPRTYLEIGVESGATLALSQAEQSIGIDPDFGPLNRTSLPPNCRLYERTSQEFFAENRQGEVLGGMSLDLAFIDGLHLYDAAIADFAEVERWSTSKTVVLMHDALPIAGIYAARERRTRFWVGDVWKAVNVLLWTRPDLRIRIIATPPSGLVVVTRLSPSSERGPDFYRDALTQMAALSLEDKVPAWPAQFPVVSNDAAGYREALGL